MRGGLWLFLLAGLTMVGLTLFLAPVRTGVVKISPAVITGEEPVNITISVAASMRLRPWSCRAEVTLSNWPGEQTLMATMARDGSRWVYQHRLPSGIALGVYTVSVRVVTGMGFLHQEREAIFRVMPEEGHSLAGCDHAYFRYQGRRPVDTCEGVELVWPGSSVEVRFRGTRVAAEFYNTDTNAIFYAILDGRDSEPIRLELATGRHVLPIAESLSDTWHTLTLHRLTEMWNPGHVRFLGLHLEPDRGILPPDALSGRRIEFYGDSITSGNHAEKGRREGDEKSRPNNYLAYSARIARAFRADWRCIAQSGIALTSQYTPFNGRMDTFYRQTFPMTVEPLWDFASWQTDAVVVHVLTNDDWFWGNMPNPPSDGWFQERYQQFILGLRAHYPSAHIFCVLGTMPSVANWPPPNPDMVWVIEESVRSLRASGDDRVFALMFKYQHPDPGHPSAWHHEHLMAAKLIPLMERTMGWVAEYP